MRHKEVTTTSWSNHHHNNHPSGKISPTIPTDITSKRIKDALAIDATIFDDETKKKKRQEETLRAQKSKSKSTTAGTVTSSISKDGIFKALQNYEQRFKKLAYDELPSHIHIAIPPLVVDHQSNQVHDNSQPELSYCKAQHVINGEGKDKSYSYHISVDLSQWSLVIRDKCILSLVEQYEKDVEYDKNRARCQPQTLDKSSIFAPEMIDTTTDPTKTSISDPIVTSMDLSGGHLITDLGLQSLAQTFTNMSTIKLDNIFQITERGLKKLVMSCRSITHLSLSGCLGISGAGFAIIGQCCANTLKCIHMSACRQVKSWALRKIWESCHELEEVDVSYCPNMMDGELKALSVSCPLLRVLNVKECCQISDSGVLTIFENCNLLESFNMARSTLPLRITDTALMALDGDGVRMNSGLQQQDGSVMDTVAPLPRKSCKEQFTASLLSINLSGCDVISDAGISWIAKSCKGLEHIYLSNCTKISNGGIRYLGEECPKLKTIVMANVKKVSDVGLRHLADGCPNLEYINASGLYMLSNGVKRNFGYGGLQAIGVAKCRNTMKKLNLHGCFKLGTVALMSIAEMAQLETLILSGCTDLSLEGMTKIAQNCSSLRVLSMASCGNCVTNDLVEAMTPFMKSVEILNLSDCAKVGRRSLKSITQCMKLCHLDVSGCTSITNDAILALCEGEFEPGLRALYLDRCHKIDDTSLTWITDGMKDYQNSSIGAVTLLTLTMKGTKISYDAAKSMGDNFCFSELKANKSFFGYLALSRPDDRKMINTDRFKSDSATKIQALFRARRSNKDTKEFQQQFAVTKAALKIATMWRVKRARKRVEEIKHHQWLCLKMAIKLQASYRTLKAKMQLHDLKKERWLRVAPHAATKIQKVFRGMKAYKDVAQLRLRMYEELQEQKHAATIIQTLFRMVLAKILRDELIRQKVAYENLMIRSCTLIQSQWRKYLALERVRNIVAMIQQQIAQQKEKERKAATSIVRWKRALMLQSEIERRVMLRKLRNDMARNIQVWFHKLLEMQALRALIKRRIELKRIAASKVLQRCWRRYLACQVVNKLRQERDRIHRLKAKNSLIITSWCRMVLAKHHVNTLRHERKEFIEKLCKLQIWSATKIESCWRGHRGRIKAKSVSKAKKSRWKKMLSEEDGRYFYYNQVTGESRWRKPQDILDLEEKHICQNCLYYEARVECASCKEYFCNSCWDAVHFGGKRKHHEFRSLYDYYGKRVDYGETEWPSRWPTEIEQDEKDGWHLRVQPYREPSHQVNGYNVYHDEDTKRDFYHDERKNKGGYMDGNGLVST